MPERALILWPVPDVRPVAPVVKLHLVAKPTGLFQYSAETRLDMQRQDREWLRSARPTDSDWDLGHVAPGEWKRNG